MESKEPFDNWLEAFKGEFEAAHSRSASEPAPATPASLAASQGFDSWWKLEQEPLLKEPAAFASEAPRAAPAPAPAPAAPEDAGARIERLSSEKAALLEQVAALARESQGLREAFSRLRAESAALEGKLAQTKEAHEGRLGQVQGQLRACEQQLKSVTDDKAFLQQNFNRYEDSHSRLEEELKLEREKSLMTERQGLELRQRVMDLEAKFAKAREEAAFHSGAAEELKRHSSVHGERLVRAKELTDADVAGLRMELKMFAEEIKLILRTIRQERAP